MSVIKWDNRALHLLPSQLEGMAYDKMDVMMML